MLQGIRDRSQSWIMWVIIGLLILVFALFGISSYLGPSADPAIAKVNGHEILLRTFQDQLQRQRYRLQEMAGSTLNLTPDEEVKLKEQVIDLMVEEELMIELALDDGLYISDQQLADVIRQMQAFQDDGQFSQARYEQVLLNQGYRPGNFEYFFRRNLLVSQINMGIVSSEFITPDSFTSVLNVLNQSRTFSTLNIPASEFTDQINISDSDVETYFKSNPDKFVSQEKVSVDYVQLDEKEIAKSIEINDEDAKKRFNDEMGNYITAEERHAKHILILVPDPDDQDEVQAAKEKILAIKAELDAGGDFAEIAKAKSNDPGSASQGGDLGFFPKGVMDKAFEESVFSLNIGEISEPVLSSFGYHLIKLEGIKTGEQKPFDEVKEEVISQMQNEKAEQLFAEKAEQFSNLVFESPDSLDEVAAVLDLEIKTTELFTRSGGTGIAAEQRFINASFSDEVRQGHNSEPLELTEQQLVSIHLKEYLPASQKTLASVSDEIRALLVTLKASEKASEKGKTIIADISAGKSLEAVSQETGLSWEKHDNASRGASLEPVLLNTVFKMPHPGDTAVIGGITLNNGDFSVISLESVNNQASVNMSTDAKANVMKELSGLYGKEIYSAFNRSIKSKATIDIHRERL